MIDLPAIRAREAEGQEVNGCAPSFNAQENNMKTNPTPKPAHTPYEHGISVLSDGGVHYLVCSRFPDCPCTPRIKASLAYSAPNLLAALKECEEYFEETNATYGGNILGRIRAIISKAEGGAR